MLLEWTADIQNAFADGTGPFIDKLQDEEKEGLSRCRIHNDKSDDGRGKEQ